MSTSRPATERLRSKAKGGFAGYPLATVIFYGPDNQRASKVAVGIVRNAKASADPLERWITDESDARADETIGAAVLAFLHDHNVRSVVIADGIQGCPHEEGVDYPMGGSCPQCPYWAGRPRGLDHLRSID